MNVLSGICRVSDCPVSHDAERGYGATLSEVEEYVRAICDVGAVGINLEDGLGSDILRDSDDQAERIAAAKTVLGDGFLNARTDVFFVQNERANAEKLDDVLQRAAAYAEAGADGLFVPGLQDLELIQQIVTSIEMPLNIMRPLDGPSIRDLSSVGVARISHGPFPWLKAMADFRETVES